MSEPNTVTFCDCLMQAANTPELVEQFDRLCGASLSKIGTRSPIDRMIDEATGFEKAQIEKFAAFVYECIWLRLPDEVRE